MVSTKIKNAMIQVELKIDKVKQENVKLKKCLQVYTYP